MPSYYYTKFQKNPCVGRNERCPFCSISCLYNPYLVSSQIASQKKFKIDALLYCYCNFHPYMPNGLCYLNNMNGSFLNRRGVWFVLLLSCFIKNPVLNVNSVDSDQTPRSAASDLGLHCLPTSRLWDAGHK